MYAAMKNTAAKKSAGVFIPRTVIGVARRYGRHPVQDRQRNLSLLLAGGILAGWRSLGRKEAPRKLGASYDLSSLDGIERLLFATEHASEHALAFVKEVA